MATLLTDGSGNWFELGITVLGSLTTTAIAVPSPAPSSFNPMVTDGLGNWFTVAVDSLGDLTTSPTVPPLIQQPPLRVTDENGYGWTVAVNSLGALTTILYPIVPVPGAGFLIANDILTDCAFMLIQPSVNTTVNLPGIAVGLQTVPLYDPSMYPGAKILVGTLNLDLEVVTIEDVVPNSSFTARFALPHPAGSPVVGATFPVRQTSDPLFEQDEMLAYLSQAVNDFLSEVPLVYTIGSATLLHTQQTTLLPSDCMYPVRIATNQYPLRETSQANLDAYDYRWNQQEAIQPAAYFRDKVPVQTFGVWPRQNNRVDCEVIYAARGQQMMGLGDGFAFPDPFLPIVRHRVLSFAYSKDGEGRNPGLAKYWDSRFQYGVKIAKMVLDVVEDSNLEMQ